MHIADVSYFIEPGSALDHEASQRATSVYLVQKVCYGSSVICESKFTCRSFQCYLVCCVNTYVVSILMRYSNYFAYMYAEPMIVNTVN